jgi:rhamnosyltransferase subunit B
LITDAEFGEVLANPDFWHPLKAGLVAARWGAPLIARQYELIASLARDPDAVLVASPGVLAARLVQEKLRRPMASIILQPWMIPSISAPPVMPGGLTLPRWAPRPLGRLYWWGFNAVGDRLVGSELNRLRRSLGLEPVRQVFRWWLSPELVLGLFPDWYGPPQADWPAQVRLTGFPTYDGRSGRDLPAEVIEFCSAGDPPAAFTFGTGMMHATDPFRAAVDACAQLGLRGLLLTKFEQQLPPRLPPTVRHCAFAPFQQLFPLCAAVVHHGGIGTTARALAAGTPQLVLPFAYDQLDNARRVERLGAGEWLRARRANGRRMAKALDRLVSLPFRAGGRARSAALKHENGLNLAADWIEELGASGASTESLR